MTEVCFGDTAFFLAILKPHDEYHRAAIQWQWALLRSGVGLVTTEWVLWELLNALAHPTTRQRVVLAYRHAFADEQTLVVEYEPSLRDRALELFESRKDKAWSLTDCASFVVMRERRLRDALTSDHHFEQAGFRALLLAEPDTP